MDGRKGAYRYARLPGKISIYRKYLLFNEISGIYH